VPAACKPKWRVIAPSRHYGNLARWSVYGLERSRSRPAGYGLCALGSHPTVFLCFM